MQKIIAMQIVAQNIVCYFDLQNKFLEIFDFRNVEYRLYKIKKNGELENLDFIRKPLVY